MINAWLARLTAAEAGRHKTNQHPSPVLLPHHQRAPTVTLARVLTAIRIPGAQHLRVQDHVDAALLVQALALLVLDQWHINHLQHLGPLLLLWHKEGQGSQLLVGYDGAPTGRVCNRTSLVMVLI